MGCKEMWTAAGSAETYIKQQVFTCVQMGDPVDFSGIQTGIQKALNGTPGARLDWQNEEWDGATLLLKMVRLGSWEMIMFLQKLGADHTLLDNSGRGALHWAAIQGEPQMMHVLLREETKPPLHKDQKDSGGDAPLHLAAYYGNIASVRLLVRAGANVDLTNDGGFTARELASASRKWHVAQYLADELRLQEKDRESASEEVNFRDIMRKCDLDRANKLKNIIDLEVKPKAKAKAKAKGK